MVQDGKFAAESFEGEGALEDNVVQIYRSAKVVKGGRRFSFSALVVVGNRNGRVGIGYGKANEVPQAVEKGIADAKKNLFTVSLAGRTLPHLIKGRYGSSQVLSLIHI